MWIQRALQKAPDERFVSVEEFRWALADAQSMASLNEWTGRSDTTRGAHPPRHGTPRWAQNAIAAMLVLAAAGIAWRSWGGTGVGAPSGESAYVDSVAVMPFQNLTGDPANDHLGVGLADEITEMLAQVPEVKVISRHSVDILGAAVGSIPQLLEELGARHLIQGTVELEAGQIVVTVSHGDEETGDPDPASYEDTFADWFAAEARLAAAIARDFLEGIGVSPVGMTASEGGAGHEATLTGIYWLNQRTADGFPESHRVLRRGHRP